MGDRGLSVHGHGTWGYPGRRKGWGALRKETGINAIAVEGTFETMPKHHKNPEPEKEQELAKRSETTISVVFAKETLRRLRAEALAGGKAASKLVREIVEENYKIWQAGGGNHLVLTDADLCGLVRKAAELAQVDADDFLRTIVERGLPLVLEAVRERQERITRLREIVEQAAEEAGS